MWQKQQLEPTCILLASPETKKTKQLNEQRKTYNIIKLVRDGRDNTTAEANYSRPKYNKNSKKF